MSFFLPSKRERLADDLSMWDERPPKSEGHQCQWVALPSAKWSHPDVRTLVCMVPGCGKTWEMDLRLLDEEGDRL